MRASFVATAGCESARGGKREKGVFKRRAGDLEVTNRRIAQHHLANDLLSRGSGHDDAVAALLHGGHAGNRTQELRRKPGVAANLAARAHALDLRGRSLAHDLSFVDDDDPVSQRIGLLQIVSRKQHGLAAIRESPNLQPETAPSLDVIPHSRPTEDTRT